MTKAFFMASRKLSSKIAVMKSIELLGFHNQLNMLFLFVRIVENAEWLLETRVRAFIS